MHWDECRLLFHIVGHTKSLKNMIVRLRCLDWSSVLRIKTNQENRTTRQKSSTAVGSQQTNPSDSLHAFHGGPWNASKRHWLNLYFWEWRGLETVEIKRWRQCQLRHYFYQWWWSRTDAIWELAWWEARHVRKGRVVLDAVRASPDGL